MIVSQFQPPKTITACRKPQAKTEYAAGFRNFNPHQTQSQNQPPPTIPDYLAQTNIAGLAELYRKQENQDHNDRSSAIAQQKQSVSRLYQNVRPKDKKGIKKRKRKNASQSEGPHQSCLSDSSERSGRQDSEQKGQKGTDEQKKGEMLWKLDDKYRERPNYFIIEKEIRRVHQKFIALHKNACKKKKQAVPFQQACAAFLIKEQRLLSRKAHSDEDVVCLWKSYLSGNIARPSLPSCTIQARLLHQIKLSNRYLFCLLQGLGESESNFSKQQIAQAVPDQISIPKEELIGQFGAHFHYTQPFDIKYEVEATSQVPKQEQPIHAIKANPIPKTTYAEPKQRTPVVKSTQPIPFNLSNPKKDPVSFDQYYQWKRQFKAGSVPKTTYNPHSIKLLTEEERKYEALKKLNEASYPTSMEYLAQYRNHRQHIVEELAGKFKRSYSATCINPIPNFNQLHAKELVIFQKIREQNKVPLKTQPFNLSQNKPKTNTEQRSCPQTLPQKKLAVTSNPPPPAKSTLKFDSYVNFRNEKAAEQKMRLERIKKEKQAEDKKMENLKRILKARVQEELDAHPKIQATVQASQPYKIDIGLQKIYRERPLLMGSRDKSLPWKSIFDDS